jgi:hypothetical protein
MNSTNMLADMSRLITSLIGIKLGNFLSLVVFEALRLFRGLCKVLSLRRCGDKVF